MNRMFPSLMLDTMHQAVDSATELQKATRVSQQLCRLSDAIPAFREMVLARLNKKLSVFKSGLEADRIFIARGRFSKDIENRPTGSLTNVFFDCLSQRKSPNYVNGDDAVYDRADSNAVEHEIAGLTIADVETLIDNLRRKLDWEHPEYLDAYWNASVAGQPLATHKANLHQAIAQVLMAQLSLSVFAGRLETAMASRVADALSASGASRYALVISNRSDQVNGFVVNSSGLVSTEIEPSDDLYGYVLYTSERGFEYFPSSLEMHTVLCERFSLTGKSITFPYLHANAFDHCVGQVLKQQRNEIKRLLTIDSDPLVGSALMMALERQQQLMPLQSDCINTLEELGNEIQRVEWTGWLKDASVDVQNTYVELERSMIKYDSDFKRAHGPYFSLREFTRTEVANWCRRELGVSLDSEAVRVHTTYDIKAGGKTIRQQDSWTLTEFVSYGMHDAGHHPQLMLEGADGTGLTTEKLQRWMNDINLRRAFVETRSATPPADYYEAFCNKIHSRLRFDLLVARHSGVFDQSEFDLVSRSIAGDPTLPVQGVTYAQGKQPLRDVLVFQGPRGHDGPQLVYLRTTRGVHAFQRFSHFAALRTQLVRWMLDDAAYASSQIHPDDWARVELELRQKREQWWLNPAAMSSGHNPLADAVNIDYRYCLATAQSIAPPGYRNAPQDLHRRHARLNTELKALATMGVQHTGFVSFEVFSRQLIKARVEQLLQTRGSHLQVDPDQVFVQVTAQTTYTLSQVIFQQHNFEPPSSPHYDPSDFPRFYCSSGHPVLDALSIRDIASWSKTLRAGELYIEHLKQEHSPLSRQYAFKQDVYYRRQLAEMARAAISQLFDGSLNPQQYNSLERIIASLHSPEPPRAGDPVARSESVYEFMLNTGRRVDGVYLFRAVTSVGIEDFIYTPNAPDGLAFRKASEFAWSIRDRFKGLRTYYIERVKSAEKKSVNTLFDKILATTDPVSASPQINARVRDLRPAYAAHVNKVIHDVDEQSTSLGEIIGKLIYDNVKLALSVISIAIPPAGLVLTAIETAKNVYDGLYALRYENHEKAFTHLKDALIGLATLGKAATASGTASVTKAQKTLINLLGDANTLVGLVGQTTGQTVGKERLLEIIQQVLDEKEASNSRTTII